MNSYFDPNTNTISFASKSGVKLSDGSITSPALVFLHELAHADNFNTDPSLYERRVGKKNDVFQDEEESEAIRNTEHRAARAWGEPERKRYEGEMVRVNCVTCREEVRERKEEVQ